MSNVLSGICKIGRGVFRWCYDYLMKLDIFNCVMVFLEINGRIKMLGWCVYMY